MWKSNNNNNNDSFKLTNSNPIKHIFLAGMCLHKVVGLRSQYIFPGILCDPEMAMSQVGQIKEIQPAMIKKKKKKKKKICHLENQSFHMSCVQLHLKT